MKTDKKFNWKQQISDIPVKLIRANANLSRLRMQYLNPIYIIFHLSQNRNC